MQTRTLVKSYKNRAEPKIPQSSRPTLLILGPALATAAARRDAASGGAGALGYIRAQGLGFNQSKIWASGDRSGLRGFIYRVGKRVFVKGARFGVF